MGSDRKERFMFSLMPLGGSFVIFTLFCRMDTGKAAEG